MTTHTIKFNEERVREFVAYVKENAEFLDEISPAIIMVMTALEDAQKISDRKEIALAVSEELYAAKEAIEAARRPKPQAEQRAA